MEPAGVSPLPSLTPMVQWVREEQGVDMRANKPIPDMLILIFALFIKIIALVFSIDFFLCSLSYLFYTFDITFQIFEYLI